ncbi:MAG: hypothetical protein K8F92_00340 [Hyphomicrobium sp.]|uniref:hypothetical protein n=1 Tax=Hyphomicrobium sp. TaxID=82 RepID=UPI0013217E3D|nr:hypothetical protein [Hyphomicrobium sp.]KAB2937374.1 MAG: hypothetical protein F9K20_20180 [Hyphomicrobium sp.]MBZ0208093.1 hypothetical protein [Hyphomicrobium sp.]
MSLRTGAPWSRTRTTTGGFGLSLEAPADWAEPDPPKRDWKKLVLIVGLAGLSWVATYVGMLELIESNMGQLPLVHKLIIGFSVAMLMTMIVWLLDQLFSPIDWFTRLSYIAGYVFLTIISVGFGFGFYWKVLESRSEAARSAESAVGQVQSSLHGAATRLEQLQGTLVQLSTVSTEKAELERAKGTSCPNSSPGDGPRRKMRDEDAARFNFASEFVKGRVGAIKGDMAALDADLAKIVSNDASTIDAATGTRNEFMRALGRRLDMTVTGFNAFRTDPQLRQIRTDLADRAERTTIDNGNGKSIACPDAQLQVALRGVVRAIDQLPTLEKPEIAAVEGSEATIEAFRRLTATFFGLLSFELPPSADELRILQQKAVQSIENPAALQALNHEAVGLSRRDYIPLGVAVFVDLCLLLVSIGRPMNRFVATRQSMIEAERGPVFPILSRFSEIHNHEEMRRTFDVFREVIFESGGTYYVAVPLNAPRTHPQREQLRRDAQALANLCYALEGQGVLARPWKIAPGLVASRKLRRQGSKFIECYRDSHIAPVPRAMRALRAMFVSDRAGEERPAFRIYAFKNGAWPEMILGAVMGAAGRIEAERRRQQRMMPAVEEVAEVRAEFEREIATPPPSRGSGVELPGLDPALMVRRRTRPSVFKHRPGAAHEPTPRARHTPSAAPTLDERGRDPFPARTDAAIDKAYRQRFGSYAGLAEAELTTYRALDEAPDPANSNTEPAEEAAVVVPFPAPAQATPATPRPTSSFAERIATALAIEPTPEAQDARPTIDVELRRDTATFRVPVSEASLPEALKELTGNTQPVEATAAPQLEVASAAELPAPAAVIALPDDSAPQELDAADFEPPRVLRKMLD